MFGSVAVGLLAIELIKCACESGYTIPVVEVMRTVYDIGFIGCVLIYCICAKM